MPKSYKFSSEIFVPLPLDEVFIFFSNPANLAKITPSWLNFTILSPLPIKMEVGTVIDFRITVLFRAKCCSAKATFWG